jgi:hypothetical protein
LGSTAGKLRDVRQRWRSSLQMNKQLHYASEKAASPAHFTANKGNLHPTSGYWAAP